MGEHHEYGPSNYNAWAVCPRWRSDGKQGESSNEGTLAHEELHRALTEPDYEPENVAARWAANKVRELADGAKVESEVRIQGTVGIVNGIFGTADVKWEKDGVKYYVDFKTFSDGTIDYIPQLMGYATLDWKRDEPIDTKVVLIVLHGGICKEEVVEDSLCQCLRKVEKILNDVKGCAAKPNLCKWCTFCANISACRETNHALQTVSDDSVAFSRLSICQKLVVLDAVDKLSKTLREDAKRMANENGGVLEMDGIRYEMKPWAGKPKVKDLRDVAMAVQTPVLMKFDDKKREAYEIELNGISHEELLTLCDVGKEKLANAIIAKNPKAKKVDIKRYVEQFFESTEGTPHFIRVR